MTLLAQAEDKQGCLDAFVTYDPALVIERARKGELSVERVVQRAKTGKMLAVDKLPLQCTEIEKLRAVDEKALAAQSADETVSKALRGQIDALTKKGSKVGCTI